MACRLTETGPSNNEFGDTIDRLPITHPPRGHSATRCNVGRGAVLARGRAMALSISGRRDSTPCASRSARSGPHRRFVADDLFRGLHPVPAPASRVNFARERMGAYASTPPRGKGQGRRQNRGWLEGGET